MSNKFEVGDRVRSNVTKQFADVLEVRNERVLVHWGTEYGIKVTNWVNEDELELFIPK